MEWDDFSSYCALGPHAPLAQANIDFWDPAGFTADGSVENFKRRRQTELKHGRISMLGARHAASYQSWACLKQRAASWFMSNKCCNKLRHAENGNTTEQILKDILLQHGVPPDSVQHRVQHAIKIMGLSALQSDIESNPGASGSLESIESSC